MKVNNNITKNIYYKRGCEKMGLKLVPFFTAPS